MATIMTKRGNLDNVVTFENICDTTADLQNIKYENSTLGSVAIVLDDNGALGVYMANSNHEWLPLLANSSGGDSSGGMSIHICSQDEYNSETGIPTISNPDATTLYLVPNGEEDSNNMVDEWIYVNEHWEKFGSSGGGAISGGNWLAATGAAGEIANKPEIYAGSGTNSLTLNHRYANAVTGQYAFAQGMGNQASGNCSHAINQGTHAVGSCSFAAGAGTTASGDYSHAEGGGTTASGNESHAEGYATTAQGKGSHAEGSINQANGDYSHAEGENNEAEGCGSHVEGIGNNASLAYQHVFGSYCYGEDPDGKEPTEKGVYVEIVGGGTSKDNRKNIRTLTWDGEEHLAGTLYCEQGSIWIQHPQGVLRIGNTTLNETQLQSLLALLN